MTETQRIELEKELKKGFTSFFQFSLDLIETLSPENDNLKIAVVNMQVALELFLKYYFIKNNLCDRVVVESNGKLKYKDFNSVLNAFFSSVSWSYMKKSQLDKILDSRNAIVHRGKHNEWNEELAEYLITCAFFIQATLKSSFEETLLFQEGRPHPLSRNYLWQKGAEQFAANLVMPFKGKVFCCIYCNSWAMVDMHNPISLTTSVRF